MSAFTPTVTKLGTSLVVRFGPTAAFSAFARDDELYASGTDHPLFLGPITNHVAILPFPLTSIEPRLSNSNLSLMRSYVSVET
jgi:hypothetical protein